MFIPQAAPLRFELSNNFFYCLSGVNFAGGLEEDRSPTNSSFVRWDRASQGTFEMSYINRQINRHVFHDVTWCKGRKFRKNYECNRRDLHVERHNHSHNDLAKQQQFCHDFKCLIDINNF